MTVTAKKNPHPPSPKVAIGNQSLDKAYFTPRASWRTPFETTA